MDSIHVVFAAANPSATTHIQIDEEVREIEAQLAKSEYAQAVTGNAERRHPIRIRALWAARLTDLVREVAAFQPGVVQFSGHGEGQRGLLMIDTSGQPMCIDGKVLRAVLGEFAATTRLVVLNACYSQVQAEEISQVIDCVIAMNDGISDRAASLFAASLYGQLALGCSIGRAFRLGQAIVGAHCPEDAAIPCLLTRMGVEPDKVFLTIDPPAALRESEWKAMLASDNPPISALRRAINQALPKDVDLESFVQNRREDPRYARVHREWGSDMQRQRKLNLLFDYGPSLRELKEDLFTFLE